VIEIVANASCDENSHVLDGQPVEQTTQVNEAVHHLSDAEAVTEVVKRIVAVVLLYAQLDTQTQRSRHLAIYFANTIAHFIQVPITESTQLNNSTVV